MNQIVNINGQCLYAEHYMLYPGKPTLVFLHDSLGCTQLWRDFPLKLASAAQMNYLIYDRLGYGKSDPMPTYIRPINYMAMEADILFELLKEMGIENPVLFGHSDGGTIALLTASKYPSEIKAVVAEAAHIFVEDVTLKGIYAAKEAYQTTNLKERLEKYHGNKVDTLFKAWTETWTRADYRDWNIEDQLPAIECPVLFIQGEADEYGSLEQPKRTLNLVKGRAEGYYIPGVGHTPHKESPELSLERSVLFLQSL